VINANKNAEHLNNICCKNPDFDNSVISLNAQENPDHLEIKEPEHLCFIEGSASRIEVCSDLRRINGVSKIPLSCC
jgi:hypothetical protein